MTANRMLSGSFAEIWVEGSRVAEAQHIKLTVKPVRSDVQIGLDVDSKIVGLLGEGELKLKQVYTRFYDVLNEAKSGKDMRMTLMTALKDPDSTGGAEERYKVSGIAFTELPLVDYETGRINEQVIKFRFPPTLLECISQIGGAENV